MPGAAIVGAQVARDDGMLDHAGLSLDLDLVPREIGRAEDAELPQFGFMRPVDAVTDRVFAVRADAFARAGGFAEIYATARVAVIDLCLAVRAAGQSVIYQPVSRVILARDAAPEPEPHAEDVALLLTRWRPSATPASHRFLGHALIIDNELPRPDHDAGSVATFEQMQVLRDLGWRVTFAPKDGSFEDAALMAMLQSRGGIELARPPRYASATASCRNTERGSISFRCIGTSRPACCSDASGNSRLGQSWCSRPPICISCAKRVRQTSPAVRRQTPKPARKNWRASAPPTPRSCPAITRWPCSRRRCDASKLHLLRWITRVADAPPPFAARSGLCFIGSYRHPPNIDAVVWFVEAILPLVRAEVPDLVFHVIGARPARRTSLNSPDPAWSFMDGWRISNRCSRAHASPLHRCGLERGSKARSRPASRKAFRSSARRWPSRVPGSLSGDGITVADEPEAFAQALTLLYTDPAAWAEQSAQAASSAAGALYSPEAARGVWGRLLGGLGLPFATV